MKSISDFFNLSPPDTLFHYTGIQAFISIAKKRELWASHAFYLNDSMEIVEACHTLGRLLKDIIQKNQESSPVLEFLSNLNIWIQGQPGHIPGIFVISFSDQEQALSQWRAYTPHGKGLCLGMTKEMIASIASQHKFRIAKCLYTTVEHEEILQMLVDKLLEIFKQRFSQSNVPTQKECYDIFSEFSYDIRSTLAVIKNAAFQEEREWRLIKTYSGWDDISEVEYREGASMLVPYLPIKLPSRGTVFAVVRLGPSEHPDLSFHALHMFIRKTAIADTTLYAAIPYREWR